MREPQPPAISAEMSRHPRPARVGVAGVPAARPPVMADPHPTHRRRRNVIAIPAWVRLFVVAAVATLTMVCAAPAAAAPQTSATSTDTTSTSTTSADTDGDAGPTRFARITIDSLTPSMVTSGSGSTVSITGQVTNTSSRTLRDLGIRLERGDPVTTADELRTSLAVEHPPVSAATAFAPLGSGELDPGQKASFSMSVPLSGDNGLDISERGVYPLQLNVNGMPDYGGVAQVAGSRTLLPVLSLPPDADRASSYLDPIASGGATTVPGLGSDGSISANTSAPSRFTMLWPLAAPPQLAPGVLGGDTEPVRLISEDLAHSLGDGGRLHSLLEPLQQLVADAAPSADDGSGGAGSGASDTSADTPAPTAASPTSPAPVPAGSDLTRAMCLGIDPDLLVTVRSMSLGYVVSTNPSDPMSTTVPGTGQAAAADWLEELRGIAQRMCVVALPFAGVDLRALATVKNTGLTAAALDSPADIVDAILDVTSVRGLTIPALGAIDTTGAGVLTSTDHTAALTSAANVAPQRAADTGAYRIGDLSAQTYDEPVTAALAGLGSRPRTPAITPADQVVDLADESPLSRRQAGVGALAFAAITAPDDDAEDALPSRTAESDLPTTGRSQLIVPSLYWSPTSEDADALLSTATVLLGARTATATPLTDVVATINAAATSARLTPPNGVTVASVSVPVPAATATAIGDQADLTWRLQGSLLNSADVQTSPETYLAPLREDQLRAMTTPGERGSTTRDRLVQTRSESVAAVDETLGRMQSAVAILDPGGRYTLASERSPLLLVVRNDLALPIRVNITTTAPSDLDIGDLGTIEIPARGTRQIQLPTRANSSEAVTVTIALSTVTGVSLGSPITLSVHANAYGKALFIITIIAGAALILLTARRLWHRFRGKPDPADADRPEPDEIERLLAATTYQQRRRTLQSEDDHREAEPAQHPPADDQQDSTTHQ
ncbi:DUF6049 family protein [Gordonia sp. VNQ95]|uniref:DUF6049 family protein n=1 Tax=Gordonia sp. VNQ95 TaxID=3156619 RepID=UPI0032B4D985